MHSDANLVGWCSCYTGAAKSVALATDQHRSKGPGLISSSARNFSFNPRVYADYHTTWLLPWIWLVRTFAAIFTSELVEKKFCEKYMLYCCILSFPGWMHKAKWNNGYRGRRKDKKQATQRSWNSVQQEKGMHCTLSFMSPCLLDHWRSACQPKKHVLSVLCIVFTWRILQEQLWCSL